MKSCKLFVEKSIVWLKFEFGQILWKFKLMQKFESLENLFKYASIFQCTIDSSNFGHRKKFQFVQLFEWCTEYNRGNLSWN